MNRFVSVPRDKSSINCAAFVAGIIEATLTSTGFVSVEVVFGKGRGWRGSVGGRELVCGWEWLSVYLCGVGNV